jgi:tRNA(Ile2) C34 agmatinyltransferase TiaS
MNVAVINKIEEHHKECGSKEYFRVTLYADGKMITTYRCKKCKTRIEVTNANNT